jgi:hypothetical protein
MQDIRRLRAGMGRGLVALLLGATFLPALCVTQARAGSSDTAREVVNSVIQDVIQSIRDRVRGYTRPGAPLRYNGESAAAGSIYDQAFAPFMPLGYAGMPVKATAVAPSPSWLYGFTVTGSADQDIARAAGLTTTTNSLTFTGSGDVTKIGIFDRSDTLTLIATGSDLLGFPSTGESTTTPGVAGTVAYGNGNFSTDFTVNGQWTHAAGVVTTAVSYTDNVQYRFDLANAWFVEPTIGETYSQTFIQGAGGINGSSLEVHGGGRIGTEVLWNGVRVQPNFSAQAYTLVSETVAVPGGGVAGTNQKGLVGGRGAAKFNFLWSNSFSSYVEGHVRGIDDTFGYGATGGLRWTW